MRKESRHKRIEVCWWVSKWGGMREIIWVHIAFKSHMPLGSLLPVTWHYFIDLFASLCQLTITSPLSLAARSQLYILFRIHNTNSGNVSVLDLLEWTLEIIQHNVFIFYIKKGESRGRIVLANIVELAIVIWDPKLSFLTLKLCFFDMHALINLISSPNTHASLPPHYSSQHNSLSLNVIEKKKMISCNQWYLVKSISKGWPSPMWFIMKLLWGFLNVCSYLNWFIMA